MLLPFPLETLRLLRQLKSTYKLVLISNINHEHEKAIKKIMGPFYYSQMLKQFSGIYYSHHAGMRKPQSEFFKKVIDESDLIAAETLFIDDTEENIHCAEKLGFRTWHFNPTLDDILKLKSVIKKINK
jgi:putative hydrolase of the HAD superfamily